ncbi:MAG: tail fiber protein, partial [Plesiomonas sp.]
MQNLMPEITTPDKRFHDGNPLTGVEGTIVPSLWLNDVQNSVRNAQIEIINTLKAAGLTVDDSNNEQLNQAIKLLIAKELPTASTTKSGIVQLSSSLTSTSEALAATAKAIKTVNDMAKTALQQQNNGADIPDKELFLQNLQLKDAAKRSVGIGSEQIPDMSFFSSTPATVYRFPNGLWAQFCSFTS